jgi:signal transduction histidine kinase/CheY-like chemotaxis protein
MIGIVMMFLLRFDECRFLDKKILVIKKKLVYRVLSFYLTTIFASLSLYYASNAKGVFVWLTASTVATFMVLARYQFDKRSQRSDIHNARWVLVSLFLMGSIWGCLPLLIVNESTLSILIVAALTSLVCYRAITPSLALSMGFLLPASFPLIAVLFYQGDLIGIIAAITLFIFLIEVVHLARYFENQIEHSGELRHKNNLLINELKTTMDELQDAIQIKSMFLAAASHDLRQPIHAIGLFVEVLKFTELNERQLGIIDNIEEAVTGTQELLNAHLDYSKLDSDASSQVIDNFNLQPMLEKLERELAPGASMKNLIYRNRKTLFAVETDKVLLETILRNIISNAINNTSNGGILIGCRKRGDTVAVDVWDTGIGMSPVNLSNIFKEFYQINNSERSRDKGFGLGLAIVDNLAKKLDLDIVVSSTEGKGSLFRIIVPLCTSKVRDEIIVDEITGNFDGLQVLLVDDDESIRIGMSGLLTSWGIACHAAESSSEALNLIFRHNFIPDLIISDYRLRDNLNGRQALNDIRSTTFDTIPAIMITGDTDPIRFTDASAANALLLHKPITAKELRTSLSELLC